MTDGTDDIDASSAPARSPDVAWVELEGEVVVYHEGTNSTMVLNSTGSTLWQCLDGATDLATLAVDFADVYGEAVATVEHDLVDMARQLGRYGLLDGVEGAAQRGMLPLPARLEEPCDDEDPE